MSSDPKGPRRCPDCQQPKGEMHVVRHRLDHPISTKATGYANGRLGWDGARVGDPWLKRAEEAGSE